MDMVIRPPNDFLSRIINRFQWRDYGNRQAALALAVLAHMVFFLLLPTIPEFSIPTITGKSRITVFLNQNDRQELLEQRLEQEFSSVDTQESRLERDKPQINQVLNEDASINGSENDQNRPKQVVEAPSPEQQSSDTAAINSKPKSLFSATLIQEFAKQLEQENFDRNKRQFERFKRTFNSRRPLRNRFSRENYKSIYGDQYSRASNAGGDICFVQKPDVRVDEWQTNSVLFYRCNSKPKSLELFTR